LIWRVLVLAAVAGIYLASLPVEITFEDAGLFQQVCHFGGIAHPPGYPLFTLICSPLFNLGFDPVITGNLISVFFGLCTLALLFAILSQLGLPLAVACLSVFLFGISLDFWSQAIIIEVYTLNTFLVACLLLLILRFNKAPSDGLMARLGLVTGLALSNHWPLAVASSIGLMFICASNWQAWVTRVRRPSSMALGSAGLAAGLLPYAVMYSQPAGVFGYSGHIADFNALIEYISRASYANVDQSSWAGFSDKLSLTGWFLKQSLVQSGGLFGLIALFGLYLGLRDTPRLHVGLLLVAAGNSLLLIALLGFEYNFPYRTAFSHYPLVTYFCLAIWMAIGLTRLLEPARDLPGNSHRAVVAMLGFAVMAVLFVNFRHNDRSDDNLAADYAATVLRTLPAGAVLVVDADAQLGSIGYLHNVLKIRPDIELFEADNVFSSHNLPGSLEEKREFLLTLAESHPVFATEIHWLPTATEHGLYQRIGKREDKNYVAEPAHLSFYADLLHRYVQQTAKVPVNLGFAHQSLIAGGNYLFGRAMGGDATQAEIETLVALQKTFPGAIGVVSTAIVSGSGNLNREALLALLAPHENNFPETAIRAEIAQYYFLMAALQIDENETQHYLKKAFDVMPDERNPAFCHIRPEEDQCQTPVEPLPAAT